MRKIATTMIVLFALVGNTQTIQEVKDYIGKSKLLHKDIVIAQVMQETRWLRCVDCSKDVNNLFGWTWKKKYMKFETWEESIDYYVGWQKRHYTGGNYYYFLTRVVFATDPKYIHKIKSIQVKMKVD